MFPKDLRQLSLESENSSQLLRHYLVVAIPLLLCNDSITTAVAASESRRLGPLARQEVGFLATLLIILALAYLLIGVGGILGGVGVMNRRAWGRILTFVLAGVTALLALLNLISVFLGNIPGLIAIVTFGGYTITVLILLLNPQSAREFS